MKNLKNVDLISKFKLQDRSLNSIYFFNLFNGKMEHTYETKIKFLCNFTEKQAKEFYRGHFLEYDTSKRAFIDAIKRDFSDDNMRNPWTIESYFVKIIPIEYFDEEDRKWKEGEVQNNFYCIAREYEFIEEMPLFFIPK